MANNNRKSQASLNTRQPGAKTDVEPFSVVAERAGAALADMVSHEDCPEGLFREVNQLMCNLENEYSNLPLDIRTQFASLAVRAAKKESERPALRAA